MRNLYLSSLSLLFLLSSCTYHIAGTVQSPAVLNQPNFRIIESGIQSTSSSSYLFGLPIDGNTDLYYNAVEEMKTKFPLKENQQYGNYLTDVKHTYFLFPIYFEKKLILYADIIEFYSDEYPKPEISELEKPQPKLTGNALYDRIKQLEQCLECEFEKASFESLEIGEIIAVQGRYDKIFGIVENIDRKKVKIRVYLAVGASQIQNHDIDKAYKVIEK